MEYLINVPLVLLRLRETPTAQTEERKPIIHSYYKNNQNPIS
jgi:hypothetical protein